MTILVMYSTHQPSPSHCSRLKALRADLEVVVATSEAEALAAAPRAEIILGHRYLRQCLPLATRLRWVQTTAGGVDRLPCEALAARGIVLTRTTLSAPAVARHALALAWALNRQLPEALAHQAGGVWNPSGLRLLPMPRWAMVLGLGPIGRTLAELLRAQGIRVIGVKRTPDPAAASWCDELRHAGSWREALGRIDWGFLALPLTDSTRGLFDEAALRALPRHAIVVNVGRGETLDTAALVRVLSEGHLGGAGLDVIAPMPAGRADPIWRTPRLLLTPHVGAHYAGRVQDLEAFLEEQLRRYLAHEPLQDVVEDLGLTSVTTGAR